MRRMRINWKEIKHRMIERGIRSNAQLARGAGVHQNTFKKDGPFLSSTLDRIADLLGCDPRELITVEDEPEPIPAQPAAASVVSKRQLRRQPAVYMADDDYGRKVKGKA